jgi:CDP-glycerol glycerophosphotransferase (TagB/SpsB family)
VTKEALTITETIHHSRRFLFYLEQDYSFAVLRPLQSAALKRGHQVRWLLVENASEKLLQAGEQKLPDIDSAIAYNPEVVFAPGDQMPGFIPGLKVQVFHGLNEDKRGIDYSERGLFDLYCTEGPIRTAMLKPFESKRGYFCIRETGWPKLDALLKKPRSTQTYDRPQILFGSTFTPRLSGADALYPEIKRLSQTGQWQWLVTLHPKIASETKARYQSLESENLSYYDTGSVIDLLHRADVIVSDNSSILQEFLLLKKPVVTYQNRDPQPCMINITQTGELEKAIGQALTPDDVLLKAIEAYGPSMTPFLDGASSERVLDTVEELIQGGWKDTKPANLWRNFRMRQRLNYKKSQH